MKRVEYMFFDLGPVQPRHSDTVEETRSKMETMNMIEDFTEHGTDLEALAVCDEYNIPIPREVRFIYQIDHDICRK